ncbi:hypothetical protein JG688_00018159 [Phytophthora aleatoria]|uniref:Uncharacterized protein n=1 Tax=Phytophthora aleatoria TaxID=2496075 RepID=A0A8J5MBB1_9STRA|nr:hypothetical protein JG688_00018159 [Phytophthora aleatoria]
MEHHHLTLAIATAAAAEAAVSSQRAPPENILTLHNVDFEEMLVHDEYDAWFRSHLRSCGYWPMSLRMSGGGFVLGVKQDIDFDRTRKPVVFAAVLPNRVLL